MSNEDLRVSKWLKFKIYSGLLLSLGVIAVLLSILYFIHPYLAGFMATVLLFFLIKSEGHNYSTEIDPEKHKELQSLVEEVADELNMEFPEKIILIPGTSISVSGYRKKTLNIGMAGLRSLTDKQLKAILAHEFAHLYGKDTIIGGALLRANKSLARSTEYSGKAARIPIISSYAAVATIFFSTFWGIFRFIVFGYSRQIEYRADYLASKITDEEVFGSALVNYSAYSSYFNQVAYQKQIQYLRNGERLVNIYQFVYQSYPRDEENFKDAVLEKPKIRKRIFSTHPSIPKRLSALDIEDDVKNSSFGGKPAVELTEDYNEMEEKLTEKLTDQITERYS